MNLAALRAASTYLLCALVAWASTLKVRADATYLITGGLGGLGLAAARWLVGHGARSLMLLSRGTVPEALQPELESLRAEGPLQAKLLDSLLHDRWIEEEPEGMVATHDIFADAICAAAARAKTTA